MIWVTDVKYVKEHKIRIGFSNGSVYDVDLKDCLDGEVFAPIRPVSQFSQVKYSPDTETIYWDSGADFAPEFLYELAQKQNPQIGDRKSHRGV